MDLRIKGQSILGLLRHAKDILFNNTGTTLTSTNVQDAICEVNSNLEWKQIGSTYTWSDTYGNTPISIPVNAKEVLVSGVYGGLQVNKIIAPITFPSSTLELIDGYYETATNNGYWSITTIQGAIGLRAFVYNDTNVGANVTAKVYYR